MKHKLPHPYQSAMITIGGLVAVSLLVTVITYFLSRADLVSPQLLWISLAFLAFFGLVWVIILLLDLRKRRLIRRFLRSERVLIHWTYLPTEWKRIKTEMWDEDRNDWRVQWGCLSILLAAAGLLTGVFLGLGEGFGGILLRGLLGMLAGGGAGLLLGGLVAGGNTLGGWLAFRDQIPRQVALGRGEVFAIDDYFRANGNTRVIQSASLEPGSPAILVLELLFPPRPRMPQEETWRIPVPPGCIERIEQIMNAGMFP